MEQVEGLTLETAAIWSLFAYGVLLVVGGVLGYVLPEKPSKASLIAGVITGGLSIGAFFLARQSGSPGLILGLVVATVTELMMAVRLSKTRKMMPSGMVVLLSLVVQVLTALAIFLDGN